MNSNAWQKFEASNPQPTDQLILLEGVFTHVMFVGPPPHPFDAVYVTGRGYLLPTPGVDPPDLRVSRRAAVNVYVVETRKVLVFEQGIGLFNEVVDLQGDHPLPTSVFSLSRTGKLQDTRHHVRYLRPALPRERDEVARAETVELASWVKARFGRPDRAPPAPAAPVATAALGVSAPVASGRIGSEDLRRLERELADLPDEATAALLAEFGVASLADLPVDQANPAYFYAAALASEYPPRTSLNRPLSNHLG